MITADRKIEILKEALENIMHRALEHPCCDHDLLNQGDLDELTRIGGDVCDWTILAWIARDALNEIQASEGESRNDNTK